MCKMQTTAADIAWSVCLLGTLVSRPKTATAKPIKVSFGARTRVNPRNHILDVGLHTHREYFGVG